MKAINRAGNLKRIVSHPDRKRRQEDASKRLLDRVQRTSVVQLDLLFARPGASKRELARLAGAL